MQWLNPFVVCLLVAVLGAVECPGGDLLPAETAPQQAMDHYIDARLQQAGVSPALPADDANFMRRVMLDLVGRPPTAFEARGFIGDSDPEKRTRLVDQLLTSPGFVRQQAAEFDAWLMQGTKGTIHPYLHKAFSERRTWDRMFREMIVGEADDPRQQGAIRFVATRAKDLDQLLSDSSIAFFGVNVTCAKCHDHPLVDDWRQDHYYGMLSFFSRTFGAGEFLGERDYGQVSFKTVEGETRDAQLMFLSGQVVAEAPSPEPDENAKKEERKLLEELKQKKEPPPTPSYSRRAALVSVALDDQEHLFLARAIVNHLWNRFLGRGLVMPVDQMHSENAASHPELLSWLARDVRASGYDLTRLIRGIVLSRAYARTSRWDSAVERPSEALFAVAQVRPLQPWQYAMVLKLGATSPDELDKDESPEDFDRRIETLEKSARGMSQAFDEAGVAEALLLSNGAEISSNLLADRTSTLVGRLGQCEQSLESADLAIWNVFARPPAAGEAELLINYLSQRTDRGIQARQQLVWALLTSSECRFNY